MLVRRLGRTFGWGIAFVALAGCDAGAKPVPAPAPTPSVDIVQPKVVFPPASKIAHDVRRTLPIKAQRSIGKASMPVLAPNATQLKAVALVVEPEFYALSAKTEDGASVSIQGTRARIRHAEIPSMPGKTPLHDGIMGHVTQNEGIWSASWMENEIAYSVDFECASPEDAACADSTRVIAIAKSVAYVGGRGVE